MSYLVLARKWRPQAFRDLIGQEHVSQTLKNAIDSGRVAHAFLFTGGRGVGKTSAARILAKTLNCERGPASEPCNECSTCKEITSGNSVDVFEIDGASNNSVDDIRELRETVKYLPSHSRYKIFIIDEVHMLSTSAFNALLKTLEEPPAHVKFIFATTEPQKVPITILSRCQRFDFKKIPLQLIMARLRFILEQEGIAISDPSLAMISRKGDGSMRDSLSTLDQVLAFCGDNVSDEDVITLLGVVDRRLITASSRAVFARDCPALLEIIRQVDSFGSNMRIFCQEMIDHFRSLAILKAGGGSSCVADLTGAELKGLTDIAAESTLGDLQRHLAILLKAEADMAHSGFGRLIMEMALLKMASLEPVVPITDILEKLKELAAHSRSGGLVSSPQPTWDVSRQKVSAPKGVADSPAKAKDVGQRTGPSSEPPFPSRVTNSPQAKTEKKGGDDSWEDFVRYIKEKKPLLGSLMEHGHPLKVTSALLEIGFAAGSFQLERLRDTDAASELKAMANDFFRGDPVLKIISLSDAESVPASLVVKGKLEEADRKQRIREKAVNDPIVTAAMDIFGGEIVDIRGRGNNGQP